MACGLTMRSACGQVMQLRAAAAHDDDDGGECDYRYAARGSPNRIRRLRQMRSQESRVIRKMVQVMRLRPVSYPWP